MQGNSLMERLIAAGYPKDQIFHHYGDMYVYVTNITTQIIEDWCKENHFNRVHQCPKFRDQLTGRPMYDCAFSYDPYWQDK